MGEKEFWCALLFCMNGINQEDKCVMYEMMSSIQGNYGRVWLPEKECELDKILTLTTISCLCGQSALLSTRGTRAPPNGSMWHYSTL